jgi:hypothetical protein
MPISIMLVDKTGEFSDPFTYNPRDFSADAHDPAAPAGYAWAEASLRQLDKAIKTIKKNEQTFSKKNKLFDAFSLETKDKGVILIAHHDYLQTIKALEKPETVVAESITVPFPAPIGDTPAIMLDDKRLADAPSAQEAANQLGHGLGKYFNQTRKKFSSQDIDAHCETPLFILAAQLDALLAASPPNIRLVENTKNRLKQTNNDLPTNEMFADMYGIMLSEGNTTHKVISPLVEDYMNGPFAMDMLYRTTPKPNEKQKEYHDTLMKGLFSERSGMDSNTHTIIEELITTSEPDKMNPQELDAWIKKLGWAEKQVAATIEKFKPPQLLAEEAVTMSYFKN